MLAVKAKRKIQKRKAGLFADNFSRTSTIHPGIFLGRALWSDRVSPGMNTIASHDQFKFRGQL